jgi:hypothetical protein
MKPVTQSIILLLTLALLIQNTCPLGFAGKSTVASTCLHCPERQTHHPVPDGEGIKISIQSHSTAHLPIFVLDIPNTQTIFRFAVIAIPQPVMPNTYKNTAPDELLRPPRA